MAILQSTSITGSLEVTGSTTVNGDLLVDGYYKSTNNTNTEHIFYSTNQVGTNKLVIWKGLSGWQSNLIHYLGPGGVNQRFGIEVGNTEALSIIKGTENVGIGTISPQERLHVVGNAVITGSNNLTGTYALKVADSNNNSILAVQNDGKVGIGTDSPSRTLSVNGDASFGQAFIKSLNTPAQLHLGYGNGASVAITTQRTLINIKGGTASDGSGGSNYFTIQPMRNGGANFSAAGTDLNSDKLTLYYQQFDSDSNYIGAIRRQAAGWFATNDHRMIGIGDSDYSNDSAGTVLWYTNNQTYHKGLLLSKTGNVGINTTSPSERLHVSGNLKIDGVVTGSLTVASSGSTVLDIQGSQGQLFSVVDSFSGSLFKVATVSGAPVIEAFSDNRVNIGAFNNEAIKVNGSNTTLGGTLSIPGFNDVSASLAAAVAGGDNLGNHTATQNLNMGTYAIINVGNVDGVDVSDLKDDFDAFEAAYEATPLISGAAQISDLGFVDKIGAPQNNQIAVFTDNNTIEGASNLTWTDTVLNVGSNGSIAQFNSATSVIFNNGNDDAFFQVKGSSDDDLLNVNRNLNNRVGIGTATPSEKLEVVGNTYISGKLNVNTSFTASNLNYPDTDGLDRQVLKTDGNGNLSFGYAENVEISVKNVSGNTIFKGTPCFVTGSGTNGNIAGIIPADAGNPALMPAGIIAGEDILDGEEGVGLVNGFIQNVDTSDFNAGDTVYVGVGGGYTNVKPTGSLALIQKLGNIEKVGSNGSGLINGPNYYNDLPNWEEGKIMVGTTTYPATSSFINIDEANSTLIVDGTISGSGGAQLNLEAYEFGYEITTSFPVTGSGLIVSSSNRPANHYNMVKIGETELLDINSAFTPNTFFIHNVDAIVVASGSEPVNVYGDGPGKLFEHNSSEFKVYSDDNLKLTISSGSSAFSHEVSAQSIRTAATLASSPQYVAAWEGPPSGVPTVIKYTPISTFVTSGSNAEVASVLIKPTTSASSGSYGAGSRVLSDFTSSMSLNKGDIYFWSSSAEWGVANATTDVTSKGLLAVAATTGGEEMVAEGIVYIGTTISGFTNGNPVYLSTTSGKIIETPPSGSGEIVRAIGYVHAAAKNTIYFNPSNDFFEVE